MAAVVASVVSADVFRVLSMSRVNGKKTVFERAREAKGEPGDVAQLVVCLPSMQKVPGLIPDTAELSRGYLYLPALRVGIY